MFLPNVVSSVSVFLLEEGLLNRYCDKRIVCRNVWNFCTCMCNQTCCLYSLYSITLTNNGHKFLPRIKRSLVIYDLVLAGINFFENIKQIFLYQKSHFVVSLAPYFRACYTLWSLCLYLINFIFKLLVPSNVTYSIFQPMTSVLPNVVHI